MGMLKWLRKPVPAVEIAQTEIDIDQLDQSMNLLRNTAEEVSAAAINAAKTLQDQLQTAEFRYNSTIDHITDLVIVKDGQGRWKTLNKVGQDLFGWYHGEYYNKTDAQLALEFPRMDHTLQYCQKTDKSAWQCGKSFRIEELIPDGQHDIRIYDVIKTPVFNDDGSPKELIVVGRDVTEIREKQRRTKACFHALNSASDVIAIVDSQCRIFFCNDRFTEAFNIADYNDCVGLMLTDVVGEIDKRMWKTVQQNKTWTGKFKQYQLSVLPMMNGEPKPIYHVCTFKQIDSDK